MLLGACFLPGARHHLLRRCALNRVHKGGERLSETMALRTCRTLDGHPEVKEIRATAFFFPHFWLTQVTSHVHPLWLMTGLLGLVTSMTHRAPPYLLECTMAVNHAFFEEDGVF